MLQKPLRQYTLNFVKNFITKRNEHYENLLLYGNIKARNICSNITKVYGNIFWPSQKAVFVVVGFS